MAPRISLALAIHNHQPVGNFGWVMAEVYDLAYEPMVAALERHPARPALAPLLRPAARMAPRRTTRVHRAPVGARRARPGRDHRRRLLRAGPRLAPGARPDRPGARMGEELEALFGRAAGRCLAGRTCLGAGPPDVAGRGRLRLDDPRRRPLPRRGDPRGGPVGSVHDRGPGPAPARLRDRAGPALPDPVPERRGGHRLSPPPRHRGRRTGRDDGRRRREVRGVADDLGALLG